MDAAVCCTLIDELRQTEIQNLHLTGRCHHHVARFDVTMDDAAFMRSSQGVGNLDGDREGAAKVERASVYQIAHVLAFDVLHRDEVDAFNVVEIEDGADVWMVEGRSEPRFALETFEV